jgi:hypothetical protein
VKAKPLMVVRAGYRKRGRRRRPIKEGCRMSTSRHGMGDGWWPGEARQCTKDDSAQPS